MKERKIKWKGKEKGKKRKKRKKKTYEFFLRTLENLDLDILSTFIDIL